MRALANSPTGDDDLANINTLSDDGGADALTNVVLDPPSLAVKFAATLRVAWFCSTLAEK